MERLLESADLLIIDEVQEYGASKPRMAAIRKAKEAKYILSLSATPHKHSSKLHKLNVESLTGDVVYEIEERTLVNKGVVARNVMILLLVEHEIKPWHTTLEFRDVFNKFIIHNDRRNGIALGVMSLADSLGLKTLPMFNSVEHGRLLEKISGYQFLCGEDGEDKRAELKRNFLSKKGGVLLVSDIWKKGITLPSVEVFVNMDGGKEASLVIQRRGRVLGATETKKKAITFDFIDMGAPYLADHSLARIKAYEEKLDDKDIIVFDTASPTFISDLEDYMLSWFELNLQ